MSNIFTVITLRYVESVQRNPYVSEILIKIIPMPRNEATWRKVKSPIRQAFYSSYSFGVSRLR